MHGWGGENLDQSLRIWRCGGEIARAPTSYAAHRGAVATSARARGTSCPAARRSSTARARRRPTWATPRVAKVLTFPAFRRVAPTRGDEPEVGAMARLARAERADPSSAPCLRGFAHIYADGGAPRVSLRRPSRRSPPAARCAPASEGAHNESGATPSRRATCHEAGASRGRPACRAREQWWHACAPAAERALLRAGCARGRRAVTAGGSVLRRRCVRLAARRARSARAGDDALARRARAPLPARARAGVGAVTLGSCRNGATPVGAPPRV